MGAGIFSNMEKPAEEQAVESSDEEEDSDDSFDMDNIVGDIVEEKKGGEKDKNGKPKKTLNESKSDLNVTKLEEEKEPEIVGD